MPPHAKYYNAHAHFLQENGQLYVWPSTEGVLDLWNRAVSKKTPQLFWPLLPAEYVTVIWQTLNETHKHTHTHTHTHTYTCACTPRVSQFITILCMLLILGRCLRTTLYYVNTTLTISQFEILVIRVFPTAIASCILYTIGSKFTQSTLRPENAYDNYQVWRSLT